MMSGERGGKPSELRAKLSAKRAAKMAKEGATSRQIAAACGWRPEQVKSRVLLGQRLLAQDADEAKAGWVEEPQSRQT